MKTTVKLSVLVGLVLLVLCLSLTACEQDPTIGEGQTTGQGSVPGTEQGTVENATEIGELAYVLNEAGNGYIVTGIGTFSGTELVIPETYEGLPIREIADEAFKNCTQLTAVTIPAAFIRVGDYAFAGCTGLTQVTIPGEPFGWNYAFEGCTGLEKVTINEYLGGSAFPFRNCSNLKHVEFDQNTYMYLWLGVIEWVIDDPEILPDGAAGVSFKQQQDENGEDMYDENGEPIGEYYAWKFLPIESVKGGIIGSGCFLTYYPNLNSTNVTDYILAENCKMEEGVIFGPLYNDVGEEYIGTIWIDPLVESLDFVKLSEIDRFNGQDLMNCVNLKSITVDYSSVEKAALSNISKLSLTDINFTGTIFDWVDKIGRYYGDSCTIHCSDGDISKELGAALRCTDSGVADYRSLYAMYVSFLADLELLVGYKADYDALLAVKAEEEYESYAEYRQAAEGTEEYELYQEYLAYRTAKSRYTTTKNRRMNDLVSMYNYYEQIVQSGVGTSAELDKFINVHLPILEHTFGCTIEYEQGKEGNLSAIINMDQIPRNLMNYIYFYVDLSDPNCPQTPAEAKAIYEQAVAAMTEPGYITQQELNDRINGIN